MDNTNYFFKEKVLHQMKTILYRLPDTANYSAVMFVKSSTGKSLNYHIIRISPLTHYDSNSNEEVRPLVKYFHTEQIYLIKDVEINTGITCINA